MTDTPASIQNEAYIALLEDRLGIRQRNVPGRGLREIPKGERVALVEAGIDAVGERDSTIRKLNWLHDASQARGEKQAEYIAFLESRLEVDHYSLVRPAISDEPIRMAVPRDERRALIEADLDGIGCRNETIRLQDKQTERSRERIMTAKSASDEIVTAIRSGNYQMALEIALRQNELLA